MVGQTHLSPTFLFPPYSCGLYNLTLLMASALPLHYCLLHAGREDLATKKVSLQLTNQISQIQIEDRPPKPISNRRYCISKKCVFCCIILGHRFLNMLQNTFYLIWLLWECQTVPNPKSNRGLPAKY